jgi:hypothetical protein
MKLLVQLLFIAVVALNTALVKLSVGIPVKDLLLVLLTGLLFVAYNRQVLQFLQRHAGVLLLFATLGFIGGTLAIMQHRGIGVAAESAMRVVVQSSLILICSYAVTTLCGIRFTVIVFCSAIFLSGIVAFLQFLDVDPAWQLRALLSRVQDEPSDVRAIIATQSRPLGLSLTPIMFSYHLVTAYLIGNLLYRRGLLAPIAYQAFVLAVLVMSIANGTRSLLIGVVVHEAAFQLRSLNRKAVAWIVVMIAGGGIALMLLQQMDSRLVEFSDASAIGRVALIEYGLRLIYDNPFGLGWGFDPGSRAWLYWEHLAGIERAHVIFDLGLHNAYINFLLMYGLFGLAALAIPAIAAPHLTGRALAYSIAYLVHAFFHNDGLFLGDNYYWFMFAVFLHVEHASRLGHAVAPTILPYASRP